MRRFVFPVIVASGLLLTIPSSAFADDPAPIVSAPSTPGKQLCKVTDPRLDELSGIVATETGFVVINDGTDKPDRKKVFFLDTKCKIVDEVGYSGRGPADTEDMVLSPDGKTLWIADIGDNDYDAAAKRRPQIALWSMPVSGSKRPVLHRLKYPEGDFHNAEALLIDGDNRPLIITKEVGKPAGIYQPTAPLEDNNTEGVPLKRAGQITVSGTTTKAQPAARIGNKTISGGAVAPDATRVALRTYTDALEWDVTGGDVLGALLNGKPRTTGLPNEPFGEAITYSADGKTFYTVSDANGVADTVNYIQQYTPATTVAKAAPVATGGQGGGKKWYADLSIDDITYAVGGVGVLGLILVGAGVLGIVRHRKRVAGLPASDGPASAPKFAGGDDPETELIGVGGPGAARSGPVYGGKGSGRPQYAQSASGPIPSGPITSGPIPPGPITSGPVASGAAGGGVYGAGKGQARGGPESGPGPRASQGGPGQSRPGQSGPGQSGPGQPGPGQPGRPPQGQGGRPPQDGRSANAQQSRNPQGPPPRSPQGPPPGPQGQPPQGAQGSSARGPQQGQPARGSQQPVRGQQGQPSRGSHGRPSGGQGGPQQNPQGPPPGPQGQPPRGAQGQSPRGPQQGQPQPVRGQQRGGQGQGRQGQGGQVQGSHGQGGARQGQRPQGGGQSSGGVYGQPPAKGAARAGDNRAEFAARPESRFDHPGQGRR